VEFSTEISRKELWRCLQITLEASGRLAPRMSEEELKKLADFGASLTLAAHHEAERRKSAEIPPSADCKRSRTPQAEIAPPATGPHPPAARPPYFTRRERRICDLKQRGKVILS
ncbi:MAG TPA: hypothetical protein P5072_13920, partial [Parvularculaceae bacterium]|nr:hypothetical protein [Parvularculaceae bacterium]